MTEQTPAYLGDGVYAKFDGFHIVLFTSNGITASDMVFLEDHTFAALMQFARSVGMLKDKGEDE